MGRLRCFSEMETMRNIIYVDASGIPFESGRFNGCTNKYL